MFLDEAVIFVTSGSGGAGKVSFRRAKFQPKGGPDGGNGGKGGDIVFRTNPHLNTLLDFRYKQHFRAAHGQPGGASNWTGKSGKPLVIAVPCGTVIFDDITGEQIADLTTENEEVVIARGGRGGLGNAEFATPTIQAPRHAQPGEPGVERKLRLELKLLADVGLVGFPNAGKSTLISVISAAKPKIANYPFTTLIPNLGIVSLPGNKTFEHRTFCVADIPGLIEGAHAGKGLGIQFLRHIERNRVLVFLLDTTAEMPPPEQYKTLRRELKLYSPELADKPRIICLSKIDAHTEERRKDLQRLRFRDPKTPVFLLSAVSGEGVEPLKQMMWDMLQQTSQSV